MPESKIKNARLVGMFLLGCILLNYPILSLFNIDIMLFGIPLLYVYIFGIWAALIGLIVFITQSRSLNIPEQTTKINDK
ncbi:MAG: hypothetical protein GY749_14960 [Desulfobacteraceae bacterium]|nr:hypothetical protein [Desulfobacteraceae bacterium]